LFYEGRVWRNLTELRESLPNSEWLLHLGYLNKRRRAFDAATKRAQRKGR
jgi:hypothetical protein